VRDVRPRFVHSAAVEQCRLGRLNGTEDARSGIEGALARPLRWRLPAQA